MKQLKKLSCSFLVASVLFAACQDDDSFDSFQKAEDQLVPQAREFYEKVISEAAGQGTLVQDRNLSPGEVTPRWHEAYLKQDSKYEYVYVPIHAENNYIRQVKMKKNGQNKTYNVYISQTLCVRRDREGKYSAAYITMMPSLSHYRRNKNQFTEKVIKSETLYGDFSGYVAYNNIATSRLMVVDKVEKGKCLWVLSRETPLAKDSVWALYKEIYKNIRCFNMNLTRETTLNGGTLEEVEITADAGTYYCPLCGANMPNDHICSDNNNGNESEPWDGDDNNDTGSNGSSGSGGGGSGGGGGTSGWGGGGSSPIIQRPTQKPDVCVKVESKLNSESFGKLTQTLNLFLKNYPKQEVAIFYKYDSATNTFKSSVASYSAEGVPGINIDPNKVKSTDGYIHSHYDVGKSTLPIFSADDLLTVGQLYENSAISNLSDFSTGLYTKDGVFFLEVTDPELYKAFYDKFSDEQGRDLLVMSYRFYGIIEKTNVTEAVEKFSSMIESTQSGLTLIYRLHGESTISYSYKGDIKKY